MLNHRELDKNFLFAYALEFQDNAKRYFGRARPKKKQGEKGNNIRNMYIYNDYQHHPYVDPAPVIIYSQESLLSRRD